ncbi:TetR/AcrR family transcriptional regulator [Cytobacillus sp.]|uniref:TetR/AcrR family transcriptional regulator n=1 Tax=Cytobacillus sp. TaxID=2675269 RepID=UPI0028BF3A7F|nr:TetR/AcrR family transcriptional regulator [Cytobacillus sp.]
MNERGLKGLESRMRLLEAAAAEFARNGFHETKISTIVKKVGLTQPSFYIYFSSKEAIFEELISEFHSNLKKLIESKRLEDNLEHMDLSNRLAEIVENVFLFLKKDPNLTRIGFSLNPKADDLIADLTIILKNNLTTEQQFGYFRPEIDMEIVAKCISAVILHLSFIYVIPGIKDTKSLSLQLVDLFLQGMLNEND